MKKVKSSDPRKSQIVSVMKRVSGGTKITDVVENRDGSFTGSAMVGGGRNRSWQPLGKVTVTLAD